MDRKQIDDHQLASLLVNPSTQRKGFENVVNQYSEQLYWQVRRMVCSHEDANDILQNAFLKAWDNLGHYRGDSKVSTWLYRIVINETLDFIRRKKVRMGVSADYEENGIANQLMADEYFDGSEAQAMLQEAMQKLPAVQQTVFNLKYFDEKKYSEISEILGTSEGALKASYHIAVKKITEFFRSRD